MSNPSYSNIDRWFFELMEGNLSPEQVAQLEAFLVQHPELDVDRDMWELAKVDSNEIVYPHQKKLEKRRPVGLYMSLGFASIIVLMGLGVTTVISSDSQTMIAEADPSMSEKTSNLEDFLFEGNHNGFYNSNQIGKSVKSKSSNVQTENKFASITKRANFATNQIAPNRGDFNQTFSNLKNISPETKFENVQNPEMASLEIPISEIKSEFRTEERMHTKKARPIEYDRDEKYLNTFKSSDRINYKQFEKVNYNHSFSSKLNKFGRNVQRMMDNPVALKNMKDPFYHVPGMQAMDVNFGAVGTLLATRVQTVSRAQWLGEENQHLTNQISVDGYSYGMRGGLGFQLNHNYYGKGGIQNYNASLTYSPKFSVARNVVVEPSVRFKMGSKTLDSDQIQIGSQVEYERMNTQDFYSNGETPIGRTLWYKDLGAGLMVNTKWFFIGLQGDNLLHHYDNIYSNDLGSARRAGTHLIGTIGTDYESKKENITLSPYIVYQQQEKLSEAWVGMNMRYEWLTFGAAISSNLEPAASIGVKFKYFMFTYNADYVQSGMLNSAQLSHQLTIRFLSKPSRIGQRLLNQ